MISGPNMAGKTTYLRQVALITIMAHMGCYVPAKKASLRAVDRLLTRIGTSDSIENNSSTFMMEMQACDISTEPLRSNIHRGPATSVCRQAQPEWRSHPFEFQILKGTFLRGPNIRCDVTCRRLLTS